MEPIYIYVYIDIATKQANVIMVIVQPRHVSCTWYAQGVGIHFSGKMTYIIK